MQSGGYAVSARIPTLRLPTLVVWGRNDEILRQGREGGAQCYGTAWPEILRSGGTLAGCVAQRLRSTAATARPPASRHAASSPLTAHLPARPRPWQRLTT